MYIKGRLFYFFLCFFIIIYSISITEEATLSFTPVELQLIDGKVENNLANPEGFNAEKTSYQDTSIYVQTHSFRKFDTPIYVAFVQISNPNQLKTEQARDYPSKATLRISNISDRVNALLASNADWFTYHNVGIIYRNGELLRNREDASYDGLAIDEKGDFHLVRPMTYENFSKISTPIMHSFAFGPALVQDGEVLEIENRKETFKQRMAIGQLAPLTYVLVATDGPDQKDSAGLSIPQLANVMKELGAYTAYNLDGGQSTSLLFNQNKLNGQNAKVMRAVGDIIYFVSAIPTK